MPSSGALLYMILMFFTWIMVVIAKLNPHLTLEPNSEENIKKIQLAERFRTLTIMGFLTSVIVPLAVAMIQADIAIIKNLN